MRVKSGKHQTEGKSRRKGTDLRDVVVYLVADLEHGIDGGKGRAVVWSLTLMTDVASRVE